MIERDDLVFIEHILESVEAIKKFSENLDEEELHSNRLKQSAIVREIEIIGEASKNISKEFKEKYNEICWKDIVGTRDMMIHQYFGVNLKIVWDIITKDIPILKNQILKIKKDLEK